MIRILHMIGTLEMGGSQSFVMNLYKAIDRSKVQFDFIVDHPDRMDLEGEVRALGGKIYTMPMLKANNLHKVIRAWNDFFVKHPEYKVLHSHVRSYASIYIPIAHKHGLTTIIHSHSTSNGSGPSSLIKAILQYPLRYQADFYMACSRQSGEWLFGKKVIHSKNFFVVPNAIDIKRYAPDDTIRKDIRSSLGIGDEVVLGNVGRLHEAKNQNFLIDIFNEYHKKNLRSKLVIVGDGPLRANLERKIVELKLENSIILTGARNDVPNLMQAFDIFLFPSNWEGLPVTVVEAQAGGLPCLISNRVTKEVALTPLVKYISIDNGVEPWIAEINTTKLKKEPFNQKIIEAGFDIEKSVETMTSFYTQFE